MPKQYFSAIEKCRSCASKSFETISSENKLPIAGLYYDDKSQPINIISPITLIICKSCGLVQLKETLNPEIYSDYSFAGSVVDSYKQHLMNVAKMLVEDWNVKEKKVFEVGASNGALLKFMQEFGGNQTEGIEPSKKLSDFANESGVNVVNGYFSNSYVIDRGENYHCIIIRHVLEHIDNLEDIILGMKNSLINDGILVIEVPYLEEILNRKIYSNIYHEHLNYFSKNSLQQLLSINGFEIVSEEVVEIHGGSLLIIAKLTNSTDIVQYEENFEIEKLHEFSSESDKYFQELNRKITKLSDQGKKIHGYGASHRTFILLGKSKLEIPTIYDANPFLQNKRMNGSQSLVLAPDKLIENNPDAIIIFATSYEEEIIKILLSDYNYQGEIITIGVV